jgi:multimeric flavodoxin WrbA
MAQRLKALALNCSLKASRSKDPSSTDALTGLLLDALAAHEIDGEIVRVADFDIRPGVSADEGDGDEWPRLRRKVLGADILVIGSPIWLGQPSSLAKRVLERMDAFLGEKDERGRMPTYGKVALSVVVGNEDGAHHVGAEVGQALFEVGFTIPAGGSTYWVGEAMQSRNFVDLPETPKVVAQWTTMLASNTAHLARLLKASQYPGIDGGR